MTADDLAEFRRLLNAMEESETRLTRQVFASTIIMRLEALKADHENEVNEARTARSFEEKLRKQ